MKRFLWLSFFLLCSGPLALGRGGAKVGRPKAQRPSSSSGDVVEAGPTGCLVEKDGTFLLQGDDFRYYLKGHESELAGHDGDEVRVTGTMALPQRLPPSGSCPVPTIQVKTVQILHDNNPAGRTPVLGPESGWKTLLSPLFGLRFRVPQTFTNLDPQRLSWDQNFVTSERVEELASFAFPSSTYPGTNFLDGTFAVAVNPNIHSEGTCREFREFMPKWTSVRTIHGVTFAETIRGGAAGPLSSEFHFLHVYRHGLCYEFSFDFNGSNSTGWVKPICSVQWIYIQNERQLIDAVLSTVRFVKPQFQRAELVNPRPTQPPTVKSFTETPVASNIAQKVRVAWTTEGADYVQLRWPCIKNVYVSGAGWSCGSRPDRNFPPEGHVTLLLSNSSKGPVSFGFSILPFRAGVAYPKQSRTLTLDVKPGR